MTYVLVCYTPYKLSYGTNTVTVEIIFIVSPTAIPIKTRNTSMRKIKFEI